MSVNCKTAKEFSDTIKSGGEIIKPPCPKCPYKLGIVKTLVNPCPQCKLNGYQLFEQFHKHNVASG